MARRPPKPEDSTVFFAPTRRDVLIAPSILSADFANLGRDLARCRRAQARWIHFDVMDGHFVPAITLGPPLLKSCRQAEPKLFFDAHLMVEEPMNLVPMFQEAGAQMITIHVEASKNPVRDLKALRRSGLRAGICIKPATPVRAIRECLPETDLVLVMTVEPGFGGQALIPKTLNKVRELDLLRRQDGLHFRLQVDGGINRQTAPLAVAAGADVLVAGTAVFAAGSIADNLRLLREEAAKTAPRPSPLRTRGRRRTAA